MCFREAIESVIPGMFKAGRAGALPGGARLWRGGFTLIEVVLAAALIGVLAGVACPQLGRVTEKESLRYAARQVLEDLRWAQQAAVNDEKYSYIVVFDVVNERYLIYDRGSTAYPPVKKVYLPPGVDLYGTNFTNHTLLFNNRGLPSPAGTVELKDRRKKTSLYVIVHPRGRIRLDKVPPPPGSY